MLIQRRADKDKETPGTTSFSRKVYCDSGRIRMERSCRKKSWVHRWSLLSGGGGVDSGGREVRDAGGLTTAGLDWNL